MSRFTIKKKPVIVATPPVEKSTFAKFAKVEVTVDLEEEEVANLVGRMMELGPKVYLAFILLSKDDVRRKKLADTQYLPNNIEVLQSICPEHQFSEILRGFFYRNLVKAAAQIASNIVFSNDKGCAYTAMEGFGTLDKSGRWVVDKPRTGKTVVPVSSAHAVDLQLFCASVSVGTTQTIVSVNGVNQTVSVPAIVPKNRVEHARLDLAIKKIFSHLLVLPQADTINDETIKQAPWIWKLVYTACKDTRIPINGLSLPLIYFSLIEKSFEYSPAHLDLDDLFYTNYDNIMKELIDHLSNHSVYCGGYFVNKYSFFDEGLRHSVCKKVGGALPVKWCSYNTNKKVIWEREGAIIEGGDLETSVQPVRNVSQFDGLFYDPASCVAQLKNAKGLIVPYDRNGDGIAVIKQWIKIRAGTNKIAGLHFTIWATYGPSPLLWIEHFADKSKAPKDRVGPYKQPAVDILWKTMGTMPLYNFSCSLNRLAAIDAAYSAARPGCEPEFRAVLAEWAEAGVPYQPVLLSAYYPGLKITREYEFPSGPRVVMVPGFRHILMQPNYIPGRHRIDSAFSRKKAVNLQGAWDGYEAFGSAHKTERRSGFVPNKKPKVSEPADEKGESADYAEPTVDPTASGYGEFPVDDDEEEGEAGTEEVFSDNDEEMDADTD